MTCSFIQNLKTDKQSLAINFKSSGEYGPLFSLSLSLSLFFTLLCLFMNPYSKVKHLFSSGGRFFSLEGEIILSVRLPGDQVDLELLLISLFDMVA